LSRGGNINLDGIAYVLGERPAGEHEVRISSGPGFMPSAWQPMQEMPLVTDRSFWLVSCTMLVGPVSSFHALVIVEVIGLEAVGQAVDRFAAVVLKADGAGGRQLARSHRVLEQILHTAAAAEVIRGPEIAAARFVALDQPVVFAHARFLKAGAHDLHLFDVAVDVDAFVLGEPPGKCRRASTAHC